MTSTPSEERPRFYTVREAAAVLRRSEPSVRWLLQTKQLKAGKLAGRVIIKAEDLDAFIESAFEDH